jgi:hypothetical protein
LPDELHDEDEQANEECSRKHQQETLQYVDVHFLNQAHARIYYPRKDTKMRVIICLDCILVLFFEKNMPNSLQNKNIVLPLHSQNSNASSK